MSVSYQRTNEQHSLCNSLIANYDEWLNYTLFDLQHLAENDNNGNHLPLTWPNYIEDNDSLCYNVWA